MVLCYIYGELSLWGIRIKITIHKKPLPELPNPACTGAMGRTFLHLPQALAATVKVKKNKGFNPRSSRLHLQHQDKFYANPILVVVQILS